MKKNILWMLLSVVLVGCGANDLLSYASNHVYYSFPDNLHTLDINEDANLVNDEVDTDISFSEIIIGDEEIDNINIIKQYLTQNINNSNKINIEFLDYHELSSEGSEFFVVRDKEDSLEYLNVRIFGTMGQISHEYIFTDVFIIYSLVEIIYSEPFYINPQEVPIYRVNNHRYIIFNGNVYNFIGEDKNILSDIDRQNYIIEQLISFIEIINTN